MTKTDPNLNDDFIDYLAEVYPDAAWSITYIHWHESVGEYCVYIDDKWRNYVPEEYIFKAGFEHYTRWVNYWNKYSEHELEMYLVEKHVRTLIKFCTEKGTVSSDYLGYVQYFIDTIRSRAITSEMQDFALTQAKEWLEKNGYSDGAGLVASEIGNKSEQHSRIQRTSRQVL